MKRLLFLLLFLSLFALQAFGFVERRKDPFFYRFSYYIYPIVQDIPGLGQVSGVGVNLVDLFDTDLDFGGFNVDGEFSAKGGYFLNQHLIPEFLVLDWGAFDYDVASTLYDRGMESDEDQFFLPEIQGKGWQGQLTMMMMERQLEAFLRKRKESYYIKKVFDQDGTPYTNYDQTTQDYEVLNTGWKLDFTDDRQDPRKGLRIEWLKKAPKNSDSLISDFHVIDQNATLFIPLGKFSTWAFNGYRSRAVVTSQAETDRETLRGLMGLGCDSYSHPIAQAICTKTENQRLSERIALNTYGRATPVGGTQRLRAFPNGRFAAGQVEFYGTEFRWNLNDSNTPFNWWFMKGVHNTYQLAVFYERGTAFDDESLDKIWKTSTGVGFRLIFEGVTVRADWATGEEGGQSQIFIDYPWGLSAIDNSTR